MLSILRPMELVRRIGPLVAGVCLDRRSGGDAYVATGYVHNLLRPFPALSLSLGRPTREVRVESHEQLYERRARELDEDCPLLGADRPTLDDVLREYEVHLKSGAPETAYPLFLYEEMVLLAALRSPDLAKAYLARFLKNARAWPTEILSTVESLQAWERRILGAIVGDLDSIAVAQALQHGLSGVREDGLEI